MDEDLVIDGNVVGYLNVFLKLYLLAFVEDFYID